MSLIKLVNTNKKQELVKSLQNGSDVNQKDDKGQSCLYHACQQNLTDIILILLNNNINLNNNSSPSQQQHQKVNIIDVNSQDQKGLTALHTACYYGQHKAVAILLQDYRVDPNMQTYDGWTPLAFACYWGYTEIVKMFLCYQRVVCLRTKTLKESNKIKPGSTALTIAQHFGYKQIENFIQEYIKNKKQAVFQMSQSLKIEPNSKGKKKKKK